MRVAPAVRSVGRGKARRCSINLDYQAISQVKTRNFRWSRPIAAPGEFIKKPARVPCAGSTKPIAISQDPRASQHEDQRPRNIDLRFPTSRTADGTDAMHTDPDYSAAYVILKTDGGLEGHGFTFTIGRGNEVCVGGDRRVSAARRRPRRSTRSPPTSAAFWRAPRERLPAALARPGERRHPPGAGRRSSTPSGICTAKAERQAGVEAARRHDARADRLAASTSATSPTR